MPFSSLKYIFEVFVTFHLLNSVKTEKVSCHFKLNLSSYNRKYFCGEWREGRGGGGGPEADSSGHVLIKYGGRLRGVSSVTLFLIVAQNWVDDFQ